MAAKRGAREGNYLVEIDGIPEFRATKITGGGEKHTPATLKVGNDVYQQNLRGNVEPDDMAITIPSGVYDSALRAIGKWAGNYFDGVAGAEPKNVRYIIYDESGRTPLETWEARNCVPIGYSPDDRSAEGTGAATATLTLKPEKTRRV
jgi:phage tail-like protein